MLSFLTRHSRQGPCRAESRAGGSGFGDVSHHGAERGCTSAMGDQPTPGASTWIISGAGRDHLGHPHHWRRRPVIDPLGRTEETNHGICWHQCAQKAKSECLLTEAGGCGRLEGRRPEDPGSSVSSERPRTSTEEGATHKHGAQRGSCDSHTRFEGRADAQECRRDALTGRYRRATPGAGRGRPAAGDPRLS